MSKNSFCKLSTLKWFDRIRSKFIQFNKICFTVKGSLQFIHCGALSLFKRCICENLKGTYNSIALTHRYNVVWKLSNFDYIFLCNAEM